MAAPKRATAVPLVISRHNLSLRWSRGEVEVEQRATDPDNPRRNIVRPRLRDPIRLMWQAGSLSEAQYAAALRYREDHWLAEGVREMTGGGLAPWQRCYGQVQLDSIARRRIALQAVGIILSPVFVSAVIEHEGIEAMATRLRVGNRRVADMVRDALERLADLYGAS